MFTNADIRQYATFLFAHTPGMYESEVLFVGRKTEQGKLLGVIGEGTHAGVAVVTAPVGSGKTYLLNTVLGGLRRGRILPQGDGSTIISVRDLNPASLDAIGNGRILVVDEVDRKETREKLFGLLKGVKDRIRDSFPYIILSGDQSLEDADAWIAVLGGTSKAEVVKLESLTPSMLMEALEKRIAYYPQTKSESGHAADLIAPEVLSCLMPKTDLPTATFRDVFATLTSIAQDNYAGLPMNDDSCQISAEVCSEWSEGLGPSTDDDQQLIFLEWLRDRIHETNVTGDTFIAFTTEQCMAACPISRLRSPAQYEAAVLAPLAKAEYLRSFGIPYVDGTGEPRRDPPPYLPSVKTWLRATFDKVWP